MIDLKTVLNKELNKKEVYETILGEKPLTSGNKVAQEKRLRSKCSFYTTGKGRGTKYIVTEIYEEDRVIFDGRINNQGGNNSKTARLLENVIIDVLVGEQLKNREKLKHVELILPKNRALVTMKMVKEEYLHIYYKNYEDLESIIDENLIEKYFMFNHNRIQRRLEGALNSLRKKSLIHYSKTIQVRIINQYDQFEYRKGTEQEILSILEIENKIMNEMLGDKYNEIKINKGLIYSKKLYKKFYNNCIEELESKGLDYITGYSSAYEISTTNKLLLSEIKIYNLDEDIKKIREDLKRMCNENVIKKLEKIKKKEEVRVKHAAFGYIPMLNTSYIDNHIESIKLFTEIII